MRTKILNSEVLAEQQASQVDGDMVNAVFVHGVSSDGREVDALVIGVLDSEADGEPGATCALTLEEAETFLTTALTALKAKMGGLNG
jgi:hypothetical protein